jgi:hypothetical protein
VTRLEFLKVTLALAGASVVGCGDDSTPSDAAADTGGGGDGGGPDGSPDATPDGSADTGTPPDTGAGDGGSDGGRDAATDGGSACSGDDIEADVSNNHGHILTIPVADIVAGVDKDYVTGGTTTHCHVVTVTSADFAMLRSGGVVRVVSCNNTEHEYALSCASMPTAMDPAPTCGSSDEGRYMGTCTGDTFTP